MAATVGRITVVLDPAWDERLAPRIDEVLDQVTEDIEADIKTGAPVDRGELVASVRREGHRVYVGTDHWAHVEYGTEPHLIEARYKKALWWPGAHHPVRRVHHPGTPAQPYIRPALYKPRTLRPAGGV